MGATLDIQRQQRMDLLDQQLMLAQYNETRRNSRQQHQVEKQQNLAPLLLGDIWSVHYMLFLTVCLRLHTALAAALTLCWHVIVCIIYYPLCLHSCLCLSSQAGLLQWTRLFPSLRHRGQNRFPTQPHPQVQTQASTQPLPLDNSPVAEEQVRGHECYGTLNLKYCLRTAGDVSQKSTCSMGDVVYDKNTFQPTQ